MQKIILVTGDKLLPKMDIVINALTNYPLDVRSIFDIIDLDGYCNRFNSNNPPHFNPDYDKRTESQKQFWSEIVTKINDEATKEYLIVLFGLYLDSGAGFELAIPQMEFSQFVETVKTNNIELDILCLIDDAYVNYSNNAHYFRNLLVKHLEFTTTQFLLQFFNGYPKVRSYLVSVHHPPQNLYNILFTRKKSAYLCYPVNYFRRGKSEEYYNEIEEIKRFIIGTGISFYDPMCIDEEVLIAPELGHVNGDDFIICSDDRWNITYDEIYNSQPAIKNTQNGHIVTQETPSREVARRAKAQTPQRDFFWIKHVDFLICWRPYIDSMHHAGVMAEIQYAIHNNIPVIAYGPTADMVEHPSPFASMLKVYTNESDFKEAIISMSESADSIYTIEAQPPKYCDHTSVGVVIYNDKNEILIIERGTFPHGYAVPAGHVDKHSSYEEAAIAEVQEEVGLTITDLKLIAEGRRENPCRRVNGTWHYWKIYEAHATGELKLSKREVKQALWCSAARLSELGLIDDESCQIENVWREWFKELNII